MIFNYLDTRILPYTIVALILYVLSGLTGLLTFSWQSMALVYVPLIVYAVSCFFLRDDL